MWVIRLGAGLAIPGECGQDCECFWEGDSCRRESGWVESIIYEHRVVAEEGIKFDKYGGCVVRLNQDLPPSDAIKAARRWRENILGQMSGKTMRAIFDERPGQRARTEREEGYGIGFPGGME